MRILCFCNIDLSINKYGVYYCLDESDFYEKIINKKYDVIIIGLEKFSNYLEIKNYINSYVIFLTDFCSFEYYKKILEVADYCYEYSKIDMLKLRLDYLNKKILNSKSGIYKFGEFLYNFNSGELYKNSYPVKLSSAEKELLKILIKNRNRFLSKDDILMECETIESPDSIKVLISHLRKEGIKIENIKNLGYKLKDVK